MGGGGSVDALVAAPRVRGTEFAVLRDPIAGDSVRRFGTCGPRALASAASSVLNRVVGLQDVYTLMRQHGWCDASGASTLSGLVSAAQKLGCTVAERVDGSDMNGFMRAHLPNGNPIIYETSDGQALVDTLSGARENATNLRFHFIALLGYHNGGYSGTQARTLPEGVWAADGANLAGGNDRAHNFQGLNLLQYYPFSVIDASAPYGAFALVGREGWSNVLEIADCPSLRDAGNGQWGLASKANGDPKMQGLVLDFYRKNRGYLTFGLPQSPETPVPGTKDTSIRVQFYERAVLIYDATHEIDNPGGVSGRVYAAHRDRFLDLDPIIKAPQGAPALDTAPIKSSLDSAIASAQHARSLLP